MKPIKTVLNRYLFKAGLESGIKQQQAVSLWPKAVGKKISDKTSVQDVKHGILIVHAESSVWAQELQLKKKEILSNLNSALKKNIIKDIRFV